MCQPLFRLQVRHRHAQRLLHPVPRLLVLHQGQASVQVQVPREECHLSVPGCPPRVEVCLRCVVPLARQVLPVPLDDHRLIRGIHEHSREVPHLTPAVRLARLVLLSTLAIPARKEVRHLTPGTHGRSSTGPLEGLGTDQEGHHRQDIPDMTQGRQALGHPDQEDSRCMIQGTRDRDT